MPVPSTQADRLLHGYAIGNSKKIGESMKAQDAQSYAAGVADTEEKYTNGEIEHEHHRFGCAVCITLRQFREALKTNALRQLGVMP